MNNTKPGYQTSEFWLTLIPTVIGVLAAVGIVRPEHATDLVNAITAIVGGVITIIPAVAYIKNRTWLKQNSAMTVNLNADQLQTLLTQKTVTAPTVPTTAPAQQ